MQGTENCGRIGRRMPAESSGRSTQPESGETVFVVDDEAAVRRVLRAILSKKGYRVLDAADGFSALRALEAMDAGPDLLITDVVMPGMDGLELARRVGKLRPGIGTLFISGQLGDRASPGSPSMMDDHFLQKPFTSENLLTMVRELLNESIH
jgi:two-component system, cell cycle sensor histidine kinase and response regulator CckA